MTKSNAQSGLKVKLWTVLHIMAVGKVQEHTFTSPARIVEGNVFYSDEI